MEVIKRPRVIMLTVVIVLLMLLHNLSLIGGIILEVVAIASELLSSKDGERESN